MTETCTEGRDTETENTTIYNPRHVWGHQQLGDRPGRHPSLLPSEDHGPAYTWV